MILYNNNVCDVIVIINQLNSTWGKRFINYFQNDLVISYFLTTVQMVGLQLPVNG